MFHQRIIPFRRPKNIQEAIKDSDAEGWPKLSPDKSGRRRFSMAQPRNADAGPEGEAIKDVNLITRQSSRQAKVLDKPHVPDEMVERVAETSGGKYRGNYPKLPGFLEVP